MGLGALAKRPQVDEIPDSPAEVTETAPVAAPVAATTTPSRPRPLSPVAVSTAITDDPDAAFAGAPPAPEDGLKAATPAATDDASSVEQAILAGLGGSVDASAAGDNSAEAEAAAEAMPPAPEEAAESELPEDEVDDAELLRAAAGDDGSPLLNLANLGLGPSHNMLVKLLSSALPANEAAALATEYSNFLANDILPRISKLDLQKQERERLLQRGEREAAHQMSGGALTSLVAKMLGTGTRPDGVIAAIGNQRRAVLDEQSGFADAMRKRVGDVKQRMYVQNLGEVRNEAAALARAVVAYNEAFLDAPASAKLKTMAQAYAATAGIGIDDVLANLGKGEGPADMLDALAEVRADALQDEAVKAAAREMDVHEQEMAQRLVRAAQDAEVLQRNFPDTFDIEVNRKKMEEAFELIRENLPDPIAEQEEKRKLIERMQELGASIAAKFDEIFAKLARRLGIAPAA